jgi:hypothetical protein
MPNFNPPAPWKNNIDAMDKYIALAPYVVREPLSTHLIESRSPSGKMRYLIVDRAVAPQEGGIVILNTLNGLKIGRYNVTQLSQRPFRT